MSFYSRYELHVDTYMSDIGKTVDSVHVRCSLAAKAQEVMLLDWPTTCPYCEAIFHSIPCAAAAESRTTTIRYAASNTMDIMSATCLLRLERTILIPRFYQATML